MDDLELKVQRLDLREGDAVVVTSQRPLSIDQLRRFQEYWDRIIKPRFNGVSVLVMHDGMDAKVMRKVEPMQALPDLDDPDNAVIIDGRRYVASEPA